jgi:hypothetical protein
MTDIDYFRIIKWILIVLTAGFIGQFGKSLATYLIKRARSAKAVDQPEATIKPELPGPPKQVVVPDPTILERPPLSGKSEKKATKALVKMRKKEGK